MTTRRIRKRGILISLTIYVAVVIILLGSSSTRNEIVGQVTVQAFAIQITQWKKQTVRFLSFSKKERRATSDWSLQQLTATSTSRKSSRRMAASKLLFVGSPNNNIQKNKKMVTSTRRDAATTTSITSRPKPKGKNTSSSSSTRKQSPPWIPPVASQLGNNQEILKAQSKYNLYILEQALEKHAKCSCPHGSFTRKDIDIVMEAVLVAAKNDYRLILGASDFLTLLLSVEDYNSSCENGEHYDCIANANNDMDDDGDMSATGYYAVMTRDALVASAFHYCDCVMARDAGIYEIISDWMRSTSTRSGMSGKKEKKTTKKGRDTVFILDGDSHADKREGQYLLLPSLVGKEESDMHVLDDESCMFRRDPGVTVDVGGTLIIDEGDEHGNCTDQDVSKDTLVTVTSVEDMGVQTVNNSYSIDAYGEDVVGLSQSLARVKQAEIMSHSLLPSKFSRVSPSPTDAASIRGLLLSMSENWRALAIRSSASLYRLRGLLRHEQQARLMMFGGTNEARDEWVEGYSRPQILREAREALYVYAPLAGRLGMHRLKGELENTAFMVLYHRQYNSAMDIYEKSGAAIQSVTDYLSENIEMTLKNDEWLSPQLERLTVTSRVKKPYSLWRKLLKVKKRSTLTMQKSTSGSSISLVTDPNTLSITSVQDAIAIRVILKAKRLVDFDKDEDVRSREEFLCYYIQNRLMQIWPAIDAKRIKDYISNPKPNGYQSLHHTSKCFRYGHYWPFEVQIRTEDMHTKSEYGVAAHWDYKLKGLGRGRHNEVHMPLLDSAMDTKQDFSDISQKVNINTIETIVRDNILATSSRTGEDRGLGSLTRSSRLQSYIKALSTARQHLLDKSIFVFYSTLNSDSMEGKVLGLPVGSTVYDALVGICKRCNLTVPPDSLDDSKFDAFVNGSKASLQDALNTGDTLMFPSLECRVVKYL